MASSAASSADGDLMRAAAFNSFGGPEVLVPVLFSKPAPAPGRVLVRVVAAGHNPVDSKIRAGEAFPFTPLTRLPKIPGGDLAGIVEQAGPDSRFKPDDRVFAVSDCFFPQAEFGTYAELVSVAEEHLALMPEHLSFEEAATIPLVALTAWQGLDNLALPPGGRILVQRGSGGVGSLAVQLAKHRGWHVTTTCSPKNNSYCRQLGADQVHDYCDAALLAKLYGPGGRQFDAIFEAVGGATTLDCLQLLKRGGTLVHVWTNAEKWVKERRSAVRGKVACVVDLLGIKLRGLLGAGPKLRLVIIQPSGSQLAEVASLLGRRATHLPRIARAFPLERASDAHEYFESGHAAGKFVLKVSRAP